MKKLQNDFTTPEQSKRLLELGVPEWTANLYAFYIGKTIVVRNNSYERRKDFFKKTRKDGIKPIWSVGRLMWIDLICRNKDYRLGRCLAVKNYDIPLWENGNYSICDYCVDEFIARIELGDYDFSKLED